MTKRQDHMTMWTATTQPKMQADIEMGDNCYKRATGYSGWASRIASDPDNEPFVFKKFDDLGALNLLRMQSELFHIQSSLRELDEEDMRDPDISSMQAARDWQTLVMQCDETPSKHQKTDVSESGQPESQNPTSVSTKGRARSKKRMELLRLLEERLAVYCMYHFLHEDQRVLYVFNERGQIQDDTMLRQSQIAQLQRPSKRVLQATKQMFNADKFPMIDDQSSSYLEADDLVALKSPTQDPLSNYLRKSRLARVSTSHYKPDNVEQKLITGIQKPQDVNSSPMGIGRFKEQQIHNWVTIITILAAAIFLIGPVLALYFITSSPGKLSLVVVFTAGFATSVSAITNAKRAEIFIGTATYAAVLVVFISGDLSGGGNG